MDKLRYAGGDLMLAKCMEFLGVRCQMGDELGHAGDLGDLFRRGPPWVYPPPPNPNPNPNPNPSPNTNTNANPNPNQVYPPLPPGTILVASKGSNGAREIYRTHREARGANF